MRRARGESNVLGLMLLAGLVAGGYWCVTFGPAHLDNMEVKQMLRGAAGQSSKLDDERLRQYILMRLQELGAHLEEDDEGEYAEVKGTVVLPEDIFISRSPQDGVIAIELTYERLVLMKPFGKLSTVTFQPSIEAPIQ